MGRAGTRAPAPTRALGHARVDYNAGSAAGNNWAKGYDALTGGPALAIRVGCFMYVRRYFLKAFKAKAIDVPARSCPDIVAIRACLETNR